MNGEVLSVNVGLKKGQKKTRIETGLLVKDMGIENDAHAGPGIRQVSLLATESIEKMRNKGLDLDFGDFAENITTTGMDLVSIPVGTKMKIGRTALLRVTQIGKECHDRCNIFRQVGECVMPKEGIFAEVLEGGIVESGDIIALEE